MLQQEVGSVNSAAFSLERKEITTSNSIYKNVEAYLGEYRNKIDLYSYEYDFKKDQTYQCHLIDPNTQESMIAKALRGLNKRRVEGKNTEREMAELYGFQLLEQKLIQAQVGNTIVWASPPPENKEEGYGDYGFFFIGIVDKDTFNGKHISMLARRVNHPTIKDFNNALGEIIGSNINFNEPEDFISSPFVVKPGVGTIEPERIIEQIFGPINYDSIDQFNKTMQLLNPLIKKFINSVQNKKPLFIQKKLLNAIENLTLTGLDSSRPDKLYQISAHPLFLDIALHNYSHKPPVAAGSCGSTGKSDSSFTTSNFLNKLTLDNSPLAKLLSNDEETDDHGSLKFSCPNCNQEIIRTPHKLEPTCKHCGADVRCD